MQSSKPNYSTLAETHEADEEGGVLFHVVESTRARWNHIEDLDSFFSRMYQYHQKHGFLCMLLQEILELIQFVFVIFLTAYVFHGVNYPVLFRNPPHNNTTAKVTLSDVIYPFGVTVTHFGFVTWLSLVIATLVWILKLIRGTYHMFHFWDIKQFYNTALKIDDNDLDNCTWHEVQMRVRQVQIEQQMCIHKRELTELDIYHRILRTQNYLVAMVNKRLLPPRLKVPLLGEIVYWTAGLRFNIQLLLFWSPWSPFENPWHLKEEYKKQNLRHELASRFAKQILWLAVANLIFAPLIFVWQMLYAFFNYAAIIRKEPSVLAVRRWSMYGRMYLRHFNELEHELQARLTRAHRPASKYLRAFTSPIGTIVSESLGFYATAFLAVFILLSIYDEDVLTVEHVLTLMTVLTLAVAVLRTLTPDETTTSDLKDLLTRVVIHTHYLPDDWENQAHTNRVRKEFEQLFQYGFVGLLETILSPLLTPYILWRHVYPRSIEIVDFFRNFTVSVVGVGDVCSFAQMDVRRHGNPDWHEESYANPPNQYSQCEDGKVELSLVHFKCTNPSWKPPESVQEFVKHVQNQSSMVGSLSNNDPILNNRRFDDSLIQGGDVMMPSLGMWRVGLGREQQQQQEQLYMSNLWSSEGPSPQSIREMALTATYLHSVHSNRIGTDGGGGGGRGGRTVWGVQETTPLLPNR